MPDHKVRLSANGNLSRRAMLVAGLVAAQVALVPFPPARADYPDRVIRLVVPFAAGGPTDVVARLVSAKLGAKLGQSVIVENRPGAGANIGITAVAKAAPDGYTFLLTSNVFTGNPAVYTRRFYDPVADFVPMIDFGGSPNVIAAHPGTGFKTFDDLVAYAKANPGKLNYAIPGVGSLSQLGQELANLKAGIKLVAVPFNGGNPAVMAAVQGTTQLVVANVASAISLLREGQLVPLAQTGHKRWPDLPNVKTLDEYGIHGANYGTYYSMLAPAGTPQPIVDRVAKEVLAILEEPEVRERLFKAGIDVKEGGGPDRLRAHIAQELPMWMDVAKQTGIRID
ncbi:MAG TPA: tripartite tricarboxylate transporter substrate binding protein [Xanthobacteraceae bacterium]|nr:tripartite tricarboxylate transporter substrate binding protein [Xanthobacteraceae bacterium]